MTLLFNKVKDTLGKEVMYSCPGGCSRKQLENKVTFFLFTLCLVKQGGVTKLEYNPWLSLQGYKEFTVHMSSFHGGLDMVMAMDAREEVRFDNIWIDMIHFFIGCVCVCVCVNLFGHHCYFCFS